MRPAPERTDAVTFPVLTTALDQLRRTAAGVPADRLDAPTPCERWTVAQVLHHAAGDQHAWASVVGSASRPSYDPFAPPYQQSPGSGTASFIWISENI